MVWDIKRIYAPATMEGSEGLIAIIVPSICSLPEGVSFLTDPKSSQQLGCLNHKKGKIIPPHTHRSYRRVTYDTQEVLIVRKGVAKIDFYTSQGEFIEYALLTFGDIVLLVSGGHGLQILEDCEVIEVKSGPWAGKEDKVLLPNTGVTQCKHTNG